MDALDADDREQAQKLAPSEKLKQALELMRTGIGVKRRNLRRQYPYASEAEIDRRLAEWLAHG